jgi:carbonic anhydrase
VEKLIKGIMDFHRVKREQVKDTFARLALGQKPDTFFIACSDSRMAVNVFASTDPGDLFVFRNAGNFVTPNEKGETTPTDESELAALEFALENLQVSHIIVCGHSDCGAVKAICEGREKVPFPFLKAWLRRGEKALERVKKSEPGLTGAALVNSVSRQNVLLQLEHLMTYERVERRVKDGTLMLHGLWFDIQEAEVLYAHLEDGTFRVIEDNEGARILKALKG